MPSTSNDIKIQRIVRDRLNRVLEISGSGGFASAEAKLLNLDDIILEGVELYGDNDTAPLRTAQCTVIVSTTIVESACNMSGNAHGGMIAWLIDLASSLPLLALSGHDRWIHSGVSSNINVYYLEAAPLGTHIRVVSKVLKQGKATATVEARVEEVGTGRLIAIGTHVKVDVAFKGTKL